MGITSILLLAEVRRQWYDGQRFGMENVDAD